MKIALVVDNPYRDLPGLVLLAVELAARGARCYLVPMNLQYRELWSLAPQFVMFNYLRINNADLVHDLMNAGVKVGVLDTEGGVMPSFDSYSRTMPGDAQLRSRISCFFSWGRQLAEHAQQAGWYRPDQVTVTGAPRYDFYAEPWRKAAMDSSMYAGEFKRPMVLINGSFPTVNPAFQSAQDELKMLYTYFNYDKDWAISLHDNQKTAMLALTRLCNVLAEKFPNVSFVYRPHPFERVETYNELLDKKPNLHLSRQGTVDGWLLRASVLIQRGCSTAIDANMAGIPALTPTWMPAPMSLEAIESASLQCPSEADLIEKVREAVDGTLKVPAETQAAVSRTISDWFHTIDGHSHLRIADTIMTYAQQATPPDRGLCRARAYGWGKTGTSVLQKLHGLAVLRMGMPLGYSLKSMRNQCEIEEANWDKTEKRFDADAVRILVQAIENVRFTPARFAVQHALEGGGYQCRISGGRAICIQLSPSAATPRPAQTAPAGVAGT